MNELLVLAPALAAGVILGAVFFGGLWWTVIKGLASPQPALWFLGSMLLRMAIILVGFYAVDGEDWRRWVACLLGFILARFAVKWLMHSPQGHTPGATYAP